MTQEILVKIVSDIVIPLAVLALTTIVIPWAFRMLKKAGIELSDAEERKITNTIITFVRSAENMFPDKGSGKAKFDFVLKEVVKELSKSAINIAKYNLEARIESVHNAIKSPAPSE